MYIFFNCDREKGMCSLEFYGAGIDICSMITYSQLANPKKSLIEEVKYKGFERSF